MTCTTHHEACACREFQHTAMKFQAKRLAEAYLQLNRSGCIVTHVGDEEFDPRKPMWEAIANDAANTIQRMGKG